MRSTNQYRLALTAVLTLFCATTANATSLYSSCTSEIVSDVEKFVCQLRTDDAKKMQNLKVEVSDAGQVHQFTATPYSWVTNQSAIYFIAQTSSINSEQLQRIYEFASRAASPVGKQKIGFATAGGSFEEKAPLGSSRLRLENVLREVRTMTPDENEASVILSSIEDAIEKLEGETAERRAVVIISDAEPSTSGFSASKVIDQAQEKNIALYFVSFGKNNERPSNVLTRLGQDSNGGAYDVSDLSKDKLLEFASRISSYLENGYVISVDATGLPQSSDVTISAEIDGNGTETAETVTIERQTEDSFLDTAQQFVSDHFYMVLAALGFGVGALLVLRSINARNRYSQLDDYEDTADHGDPNGEEDEDDFAGETRILGMQSGSQAKPLAWLELVGTDQQPAPLRAGNIQLGRSKDSDIRLTNSSVHRRHAMIQMDADGSFSIHDLGTKNGVFVNGDRCSQRTLNDGDLIELGEVKLRFVDEPA